MPAATAGTVDIPGAGKVKKQWIVYGGTAVATLLAYKWYTAGRGSADDEPIFGEGYDEFGNLLGSDPMMVSAGSQSGLTDRTPTTEPFGFNNNAEWTQWVVDYLSDRGVESGLALGAVGDYLGRQPLAANEATWIRGALAAAGPPPQGGPYDIIAEKPGTTPPPSQGLAAPVPVATSRQRTAVTIKWPPVATATGYYVSREGGGSGVFHPASDRSHTSRGLKPGTTYVFHVRAARGSKPNEITSARGSVRVATAK